MERSDFEDPYTPSSDHEIKEPKRKKIEEKPAEETLEIDRISELPDAILVHILCMLPNTGSAIRTGILSKRWQFLWRNCRKNPEILLLKNFKVFSVFKTKLQGFFCNSSPFQFRLDGNYSLIRAKSSMERSDFEDPYTPSSDHEIKAPKRKKIEEKPAEETLEIDRISELPDAILVHILCMLPNTGSAIRTGILSKRWQFLWTSLPVLRFSYWVSRKPISDFINFVDKTIIQCRYSKLKKFSVELYSDNRGVSFPSIHTWIRYAVACDVQELQVAFWPKGRDGIERYKVPVHLFRNSFLTHLTLAGCVLAPWREISWTMLKRLSFCDLELTDELIQNILLGSPMLQSLEFFDCGLCPLININSVSVKEFILKGFFTCFRHDDLEIEICGPNILSLDIKGALSVSKVVLHSVPSLVNLCLDFWNDKQYLDDPQMWMDIFENISHVHQLTVGNLPLQVLSSLELGGWSSPLSKRTCLKMNFFQRSYFPGLANLLQSSPFLERLLIDPSSRLARHHSSYTRNNYLTHQKRSFHCMQKHLKFVKIRYFFEDDKYHECELGQFLLENASVLEKMVINVGIFDRDSTPESCCRVQLQESKKYSSFTRASRKAVVLVEELEIPVNS